MHEKSLKMEFKVLSLLKENMVRIGGAEKETVMHYKCDVPGSKNRKTSSPKRGMRYHDP